MLEPVPLQQLDPTHVRWRGQKLSYFSGCDYFRLSRHPKVGRALGQGLKQFGLSVAASRLTTGNHVLYGQLEQGLARFFRTESALLVPSGYVTNLVVAQALAGQFSHALLDEQAHPSLADASRFLDCPLLRFAHRSPSALEAVVRRCGPGARLIALTDGMFSRDGSVAPLKEYLGILPRDARVLLDDAHGAGVLGRTGRGTPEYSGITDPRVVQTLTLSKAFGTYGGAILGSHSLRKTILKRSVLFVGSTPLPLPLVQAALAALEVLATDRSLRQRLSANTRFLRNALQTTGLLVPDHPGPILALTTKSKDATVRIEKGLLRAGIYPPFIKYPGGPAAGYFRFVISSEHSQAQLEKLAGVLARNAEGCLPLP